MINYLLFKENQKVLIRVKGIKHYLNMQISILFMVMKY